MSTTLAPPVYHEPTRQRRAPIGLVICAFLGMLATATAGFLVGRRTATDATTSKTSTTLTTVAGARSPVTGAAISTTVAGAPSELTSALALHTAGQLDEAERLYSQILAKDPQNKYALFNLGQIAHTRKQYSEAITKYTAALTSDPAYFPALYNEALAYEAVNDNTNAIATMRKAADVNPKHAATLFNLGRLLVASGQTDEGNNYVAQAMIIDPTLAKG
jgi:Tfp pilus assembly protein PilF